MAITKRVRLDDINVYENGSIGIKLIKEEIDDDGVIRGTPHRTTINSDQNPTTQMAYVNTHLEAMGWPAAEVDDVTTITAAVAAARA